MSRARTKLTLFAAAATFLSTFALWRLLDTHKWPYAALLVILLVAAVGWLTRRFRVPAPLALLAYLLVLFIALTVMYARSTTAFLLPTPASLGALRDLLVSAFIDVRRYASPAPETSGLMLLTVGGVGVVAVVVDFVAVRLGHPAAAGLPLLALFSVSAGVLSAGPGWITFLLGAAGFLALLLTENRERLERWGRPIVVRRSPGRRPTSATRQIADTAPLSGLGKRIGAVAILAAVLLPVLVPFADQSLDGGGGSGSSWLSRFGAPTLRAPDPVVSMRRDLLQQSNEVLFRYTTTSKRPDYLRTVALTDFDGETWKPGKLRGYDQFTVRPDVPLPQAPGSDPSITRTVKTTVRVRDRVTLKFLPTPYAPAQVTAGNGWYYEPDTLTLFSPRGSDRGLHYSVTSDVPHPQPTQLDIAANPSVKVKSDLALPTGLPDEVRSSARQVTKGKGTAYEKALALQEWFTDTGGFTYSTDPGGNGGNALRDFLHTRRGYCEQYASAMAVMARSLGIPSRVAVGFTQGAHVGNEWLVRGRDAHAWPELWFEDVGWVRFEPTPTGALGQGSAAAPGYTRPDALDRSTDDQDTTQTDDTTTSSDGSSASSTRHQRPDQATDAPTPRRFDSGLSTRARFGLAAFALVAILILLLPALLRRFARRRRWAMARDPVTAAHAAWSELHDDSADLGLGFRANESPRAAASRLGRRLEPDAADAGAALRRIAMAEELARYAPNPDTPAGLRTDVRLVRVTLARPLSRRTRLRALLLPPSIVRRARRHGAGRRPAADAVSPTRRARGQRRA